MLKRSRLPAVYAVALLAVAGALALWTGEGDTHVPREAVAAAPDTIPNLVGTWSGTWQDDVYFVSGGMSWQITQNGLDLTATGTIDLTEIGMGMGVEAGTATGTISDTLGRSTLTFDFDGC